MSQVWTGSGITCHGDCQARHPYHGQSRCRVVEQGERCGCEVAS